MTGCGAGNARSVAALAAVVLAALLGAGADPARAAEYPPLARPGPELGVPRSELRASLDCTRDVRNADRTPVLLLSGTGVQPDENFAWNWMPALTGAGIPWCASKAPDDNMADIQVRGEYTVFAIRKMFRSAGRRIALFGHSQGGMVGRWPLRFWPDTRRMVADVVGAAASNQGTDSAVGVCLVSCAPAVWQQTSGSNFIEALNSRAETFRGISYTNVRTNLDLIVFPNTDANGRSSLHTGRGRIANVAVQELCPGDAADHSTLGTIDPVTWALFHDAITHGGPADPARVDSGVCSQVLMPGVDPKTVVTDAVATFAALAITIATYPGVRAEPELRKYSAPR